ncbi:hypothetical protein STRDD11_02308 [Streptococcus sp. DD11]|uniref:ubiquitin carboxyl-hydrolase n=1 Tax=Streptococcus sp. DD11 TaxID=1777879 RepID=UPI000793D433|nr:ubiquitin carboxyl-hydrolase [Streptococcus sp. DD11]KXT79361.1 hypothetical protein STRDD11_02308 [Streptococcus sp. DD11]
MKRKKIVLLIFTAFLGVGLLAACSQQNHNKKEEVALTAEEKKELRKQEEALALFLVNNFEDVNKIEFKTISKGGFGKPRFIDFLINDKVDVSTDLSDKYDIEDYGLVYHNNSEMLKRKSIPTTFENLSETQLKVTYYEEK